MIYKFKIILFAVTNRTNNISIFLINVGVSVPLGDGTHLDNYIGVISAIEQKKYLIRIVAH